MNSKALPLLVAVSVFLCIPVPAPNAIVIPPEVEITVPTVTGLDPAFRTPVATYEWRTAPGSYDPEEVRWILVPVAEHNDDFGEAENYIRTIPGAPEWSSWQPYASNKSWTSPAVDYGKYVFAVHGRYYGVDDYEFELGRNMRRILVSERNSGPLLHVTGDLIDDVVTSTTETPVTEIDVATGAPLIFCWSATAEDYGLPVTGYRYGWDVVDPDDGAAWPMPFTPFGQAIECSAEQSFAAGTHTFYVEVIDYDGFKSRVPIRANVTNPTPTELSTWGRIKSRLR